MAVFLISGQLWHIVSSFSFLSFGSSIWAQDRFIFGFHDVQIVQWPVTSVDHNLHEQYRISFIIGIHSNSGTHGHVIAA
jgi:hypothetical protein